jgi:hypothetical protein
MEMHPVHSSNVSHIGHDPSTDTMHVRFKNGTTYQYGAVSADEHQRIMHAGSIGSELRNVVRGKPYHRVE